MSIPSATFTRRARYPVQVPDIASALGRDFFSFAIGLPAD